MMIMPKVTTLSQEKKGSFDQTVEEIKKLNKNNQYIIGNVIITRKNYKHLSNIVKFLADSDVFHIQLTFLDKSLNFKIVKPYIFEALDFKLKPEYEKLEIYFSDSKESFYLPTMRDSVRKMIEFYEWKISLLTKKQESLLKNKKILEIWNNLEEEVSKFVIERDREWEKVETWEIEKGTVEEKKKELLKKK